MDQRSGTPYSADSRCVAAETPPLSHDLTTKVNLSHLGEGRGSPNGRMNECAHEILGPLLGFYGNTMLCSIRALTPNAMPLALLEPSPPLRPSLGATLPNSLPLTTVVTNPSTMARQPNQSASCVNPRQGFGEFGAFAELASTC
jgi:hypothetical protein